MQDAAVEFNRQEIKLYDVDIQCERSRSRLHGKIN